MANRTPFPRSLQYLFAIAEYGSYTRAAEALHVTQPTLSQQIKQLEDTLETQLVDRSGRMVRLTDAGKVYLRHARRAWAELERGTRALHELHDLSRGTLRVGWTPITDYLACTLLVQFNTMYPGITLSTFEMPQDAVEEAVAEDRIDVGIAFRKPHMRSTSSEDTEMSTLFQEPLSFSVGMRHPRSQGKGPVTLAEIEREQLILLSPKFALRRHVDRFLQEQGIQPNVAMETDSLSVIIQMLQVGQLATVLPDTIVFTQEGITSVMLEENVPPMEITMICRKEGYKSPACHAFRALSSSFAYNSPEERVMRGAAC